MYIQLTEQCNMTCEHCCFSATSKKSMQMSRANFMYALQLAIRTGDHITIGGGEPTLHKEFFDLLDKAIEMFDCGSLEFPPFLVTNGQLKGKAMKLLDYVDQERSVHVELSQDSFHDPIDYAVVRRFKAHQSAKDRYRSGYYNRVESNSSAGVRSVRRIMPWGRAAVTGVYTEPETDAEQCVCDDAFVDPEGRVWSCGCKKHQLGWVWQEDVLDRFSRDYAHEGGFEPEDEQCELVEELNAESADCDADVATSEEFIPLHDAELEVRTS